MRDYVTENPYPTKLLYTLNGGYDIERKIHKQLKKYKHRGEWFLYTSEVQRLITGILKENAANVEPPKSKNKRDKYKHLKTLMSLKSLANEEGIIILNKQIRDRVCLEVEIVSSTFSRHLIKLEKLKKLTRSDSTIHLKL